ncbi:MAG: 50S ribosomal protein L18 [Verrucomicrobiota bacterium]|nr:50S ribosomal protein L18 [Verrucomicrobiota bacterium]
MDHSQEQKRRARRKRVLRVRKKLHGTAVRPRLTVLKTQTHLYAQLIDDEKGVTLAGIGTLSKAIRQEFGKKSKEAARAVGLHIADLAKKLGVESVLFDRGPYKYHGLVAELATSARSAGLQF